MVPITRQTSSFLNEKVEFKNLYYALSQEFYFMRCATQSYRTVDFRCRVELRPLGVARGIKGKGPRLTFDPLRQQKMSELKKYTTRTLETHIYTIANIVTLL